MYKCRRCCISHGSSGTRTSVSLAFSTAVTASGVKSRWRGAEEQQSPSHSSASCSSSALTGSSDPEPGPTTTPSPPLHPGRDSTGSSADTGQIQTTGNHVCFTVHQLDFMLLLFFKPHRAISITNKESSITTWTLLPSLQASRTVQFSSICSDTTVEN